MALLQQGLIDLGFIGGAEIDRYGNLNTSYIGDWRHPNVRLPGSGGGADIASLARRFVVIMPQERPRFRERASFITSPGFGDGPGWRARVGLVGGGPAAAVNATLGVFHFDPRRAARCTWPPIIRARAWRASGRPPGSPSGRRLAEYVGADADADPHAELAIVRECDPAGFWTR